MQRIYEKDLYLPVLFLVNANNGLLTTSDLKGLLRHYLKPQGENLTILAGRGDDRFSQIVRNVTGAQRSFVKNGYIQRDKDPNSKLFITDKGQCFLYENINFINYLFKNNFAYSDVSDAFSKAWDSSQNAHEISFIDETIAVYEGQVQQATTLTYQRSSWFRKKALEHHTIGGSIQCQVCSFDFFKGYGEIGKGFIEIHHIKPIYAYTDADLKQNITQALVNVAPVCANCHRIIHRNKQVPLSIPDLKSLITFSFK